MAKIELRHLRTLVALRDTGSLVEAADRLCLTQSALSHQVKDVEDRLQCSLFMRKTRPVRDLLRRRLLLVRQRTMLILSSRAARPGGCSSRSSATAVSSG